MSRYAAPGTVAVRGAVAGTSQPAEATVHVVDPAAEENVARSTSAAKPTADAELLGWADHAARGDARRHDDERGLVELLQQGGHRAAPGGVSAAHPSEWVSVDWPKGQGLTGSVQAYFTLNANRQLPEGPGAVLLGRVRYVPVRNQEVTWATASNQPTRITFDPVATTSLRVDMTSQAPWTNTGFLQISELEVSGRPVG